MRFRLFFFLWIVSNSFLQAIPLEFDLVTETASKQYGRYQALREAPRFITEHVVPYGDAMLKAGRAVHANVRGNQQAARRLWDDAATSAGMEYTIGLATAGVGGIATKGIKSVAKAITKTVATQLERQAAKQVVHAAESKAFKKALEAEDVTLALTHNIGDRQAFNRKLTALQDLAERGKLVKTSNVVRNPQVIKNYRRSIMDQADKQWGATDPVRVQRIEQMLKTRLHADHLHELQLGGVDHISALALLDKQVNTSVGSQIMHQLKGLPDGTKITKVTEQVGKK